MTARLAIVASLAAALLVAPALASEVDPKALVLGDRDVPKGFRVDPSESGVRTNALEAREHPESREPFERMRRVIGYQALYARGESRIEARSDLFRDAQGARDFLLLTEREWRKSGAKGLKRAPAGVGAEGWVYWNSLYAVVYWRYSKVWSGVSGIGLGKARTLALARDQQRKIAAALR